MDVCKLWSTSLFLKFAKLEVYIDFLFSVAVGAKLPLWLVLFKRSGPFAKVRTVCALFISEVFYLFERSEPFAKGLDCFTEKEPRGPNCLSIVQIVLPRGPDCLSMVRTFYTWSIYTKRWWSGPFIYGPDLWNNVVKSISILTKTLP